LCEELVAEDSTFHFHSYYSVFSENTTVI